MFVSWDQVSVRDECMRKFPGLSIKEGLCGRQAGLPGTQDSARHSRADGGKLGAGRGAQQSGEEWVPVRCPGWGGGGWRGPQQSVSCTCHS